MPTTWPAPRPLPFVRPDGRLDRRRLLDDFAEFWHHDVELIGPPEDLDAATLTVVFAAYLGRVTDGGGLVERDHPAGAGSVDLLVRWPFTAGGGERTAQREVFEVRLLRRGQPDPVPSALATLDHHLTVLGLDSGSVVALGAESVGLRPRLFEVRSPAGRPVLLLAG